MEIEYNRAVTQIHNLVALKFIMRKNEHIYNWWVNKHKYSD